MPIEFRKYITRQMLKDEPEKLFVFGDNLARKGFRGQASQMRGEPNAVGLPTKKRPSTEDSAYLSNEDLYLIVDTIPEELNHLTQYLLKKGVVVWPEDGIGTGLAELEKRAPVIQALYDFILNGFICISKNLEEK